MSSSFSVALHRGPAGLAALRDTWTRATATTPPRFFCEWSWWQAYLDALEPEPSRVFFAHVTDGGASVAIVPLREEQIFYDGIFARQLSLPKHPHLVLAGVWHRPGLTLDALLDALAPALRDARVVWDVIELSGVGTEGMFASPPQRWRYRRGIVKTNDEVRCDEPWDDYAARLSSNFRSNLNKAHNKLARAKDVRFTVATTLDDVMRLYPRFTALESSGWKGEAGTAIGQDPRLDAFYRRLLEQLVPIGRARMNALEVDGALLAAQLCVVDGPRLGVLKLAYDEGHAKLAPGNMLLRQLIAERAVGAVSLCGSPDWFAQWKPERSDVVRWAFYDTNLRARVLYGIAHTRALVGSIIRRWQSRRR